ncbi:MAG: metalloprotease [Planctomycetota bacterium]|nr:MAG: metalloprotease [Planctomycetota bacterium]
MRIDGQRESENVEDRRGRRPPVPLAMGGGAGMLLVVVLFFLNGGDLAGLFRLLARPQAAPQQPAFPDAGDDTVDPAEEPLRQFVSVVLADTEDVWTEQFRQAGQVYRKPKLVLFTKQVQSACGNASAAVGPFYCPGDERVYLDLSFYQQLKNQLNSGGDFAQAYVVAHEVGHHVQNLLGYTELVDSKREQADANQWSVRLELQADYLAGVWARHANEMRDMLDKGDLEEAIHCARQIGDDTLQKAGQGYVVPEKFTHGTSAQRARWFKAGFQSGSFGEAEVLFTIPFNEL